MKFFSRGRDFNLFLTDQDAAFVFRKTLNGRDDADRVTLRMRLAGAHPFPDVMGRGAAAGSVNYFIGPDPGGWRTNAPTCPQVLYRGVYPGIDLVYYGNQQQLEYDFVVAPNADPHCIRLAFEGAAGLETEESGDVLVRLEGGHVRWRKPFVFQEVDGKRSEVQSGYVLRPGNELGFQIGAYDPSRPLVIDPVLAYSTFLGGINNEFGWGIALDAAGNAYITGSTFSVSDFPTTPGVAQTNSGGGAAGADAFVAKLNPSGSALVYSTYLGGSGNDFGLDIAVDNQGNAYIVGTTYAVTTFPTTPGAYQTNFGGGVADAFVVKLNPSGSALVYSTYLGGSQFDGGTDRLASPDIFDSFWHMGVALDAAGNAYVTGTTISPNFPVTPGAFQTNKAGAGPTDAFVTKLNPSGSGLIYSTFLGGANAELGSDIAVDAAGNAYVVGYTGSGDFPRENPIQSSFGGGGGDAFVTKLNPSGSALVYSTYLGGSGEDEADAVVVNSVGEAYVAGFAGAQVNPPFFPVTAGAFRTNYSGGALEGFVAKLNATGSALAYCTYLGGSQNEHCNAIALDSAGRANVVGHTFSSDFPLRDTLQTYPGDGGLNLFMTRLNADGSGLEFSTYLGGSQFEDALGIAVDAAGDVYIAAYTEVSVNPPYFPTTPGAYQTNHAGNSDAVIVRITGFPVGPVTGPALAIGRTAGQVVLSWPVAGTNYFLQSSDQLPPAGTWSDLLVLRTVVGGRIYVTNSIGPGNRFYQLSGP